MSFRDVFLTDKFDRDKGEEREKGIVILEEVGLKVRARNYGSNDLGH